jgi:hypothetical protein
MGDRWYLHYTCPVMAGRSPGRRAISHFGIINAEEHTLRMAQHSGDLHLTDADVTFLLTLLRNSASPMTTSQLVDALKQRGTR